MIGNLIILGDSYSTYAGHIPEGYLAYYPDNENIQLDGVESTWWHMLVKDTGAKLLLNCSYSGSTVCNTGYGACDSTASSFITRMKTCLSNGTYNNEKIDTIIIFGGTNDTWADSPIGELKYRCRTKEDLGAFLPAFCYLASYIKKNNPDARILNVINDCLKPVIVDGMKTVCEKYGIETLELRGLSKINGHPDMTGMKQIKEQIQSALEK